MQAKVFADVFASFPEILNIPTVVVFSSDLTHFADDWTNNNPGRVLVRVSGIDPYPPRARVLGLHLFLSAGSRPQLSGKSSP